MDLRPLVAHLPAVCDAVPYHQAGVDVSSVLTTRLLVAHAVPSHQIVTVVGIDVSSVLLTRLRAARAVALTARLLVVSGASSALPAVYAVTLLHIAHFVSLHRLHQTAFEPYLVVHVVLVPDVGSTTHLLVVHVAVQLVRHA